MVGGGQEREESARVHGSNELENKMDKKSVVVTLSNGNERRFVEKEGVSFDYQIGEHNGCLLIIEKREVESVISVPDEEEILYAYSADAWSVAKLV